MAVIDIYTVYFSDGIFFLDQPVGLMIGVIPGRFIIRKQKDIILAGKVSHTIRMFHIDSQWLFYHHMDTPGRTCFHYGKMVVNRAIGNYHFRLGFVQHFFQISIKTRIRQSIPKSVMFPVLQIRFGNTHHFKIPPVHTDNYFMQMSMRYSCHT